MSSKAQILWIDDNEDRKKRASDLEDETGMTVEFVSLRKKDVPSVLDKIRAEQAPSFIIIDHVLNNTKSGDWTQQGSTLVGFFRESWVGCPVFGITAAKNLGKIDIERYAYDELIDFVEFSNYIHFIPNVVKGFKQCSKVKDINQWINLLKPPKDEEERISTCIPHEMKTNVQKKGFASRSYRWFSRKLYNMPGFLYDTDWVATFTGIKKEAVKKYLKHFNAAEYKGIFNNPDDLRWWKAKLYQILCSKCKDEKETFRSSQGLANQVLKVPKKDRSKCFACGEEWPETVAYVDRPLNASTKQMHLRCTVAHPDYKYEPMFEEIRIMAGR